MAVKKLDPNTPTPTSPQLVDPTVDVHNGVHQIVPDVSAPKGAVKEIIYPDVNSGIEDNPYSEPGTEGGPMATSEPGELIIPGETEVGGVKTEPSVEGGPIPSGSPTTTFTVDSGKPIPATVNNTPMQKTLANADLNFNQYGDDSSAANQATAGGMNEKYTGEGVSTSNVEYNPNADINNLNYQYGMAGQWANTDSAGYLARRNDEIASALFNAGLTSKDDVIQYLANQNGWNNSTEADRVNTVESIRKRLGQLVTQNQQNEGNPGVQTDESGVNQLQSDLANEGGKVYGKGTPDENNIINTNQDAMNIEAMITQSRASSLNTLRSLDSNTIAASIVGGTYPEGEQAWRDLETYYPEKALEVKNIVKQLRGQNTINAITHGSADYDTGVDTSTLDTGLTSYAVNNATATTSATQLLKSIDSILGSNENANSAKELMQNIEADMAVLKNRLQNLRKEANEVFKGDVPDYIVRAYVANRTSEIQNNMQILEDRYNAAYSRYQNEVQQAQWEKEYELKKDQLQLQRDELDFKKYQYDDSNSSTYGYMRTERNNNPTAMTTDYAKMMGLELGVDYEIGDSFIGDDGKTYYTAKFIGDPYETAIKAFDTGAANNVFASEGGVLGHWHLGISNQKWLSLSDGEKREVIDKILKKEGGKMANMSYYRSLNSDDTKWERGDGTVFDLTKSPLYNSLSATDKAGVQGLLNLQVSAKTVIARGSKYDNPSAVVQAAQQINPDWTENDIILAKQYETNWDKSLNGGYLDRVATAGGMAYDLYEYMEELGDDWDSLLKDIYDELGIDNIGKLQEIEKSTLLQLGDTRIVKLKQLIDNLVAEYGGAMKGGNASLSWEEVLNRGESFNVGYTKEQMQTAAISTAKAVYDKAASNAQQYKERTMKRPAAVWLKASGIANKQSVADWMASLNPTFEYYFDYTPGIPVGGNAPEGSNGANVDYLAENGIL